MFPWTAVHKTKQRTLIPIASSENVWFHIRKYISYSGTTKNFQIRINLSEQIRNFHIKYNPCGTNTVLNNVIYGILVASMSYNLYLDTSFYVWEILMNQIFGGVNERLR